MLHPTDVIDDALTSSIVPNPSFSRYSHSDEDNEQDESRQPSPAALFSGFPVGSDALWRSTLAPAGDGACS
jgi:hypothetical protein